MKNSLYKINNEFAELMQNVEAMEGEITPEIEKQLQINESQLQGKSIAYLSVIKKHTAHAAAIDDEIKRLQALKKRSTTLTDRLKASLLDAVKLYGEIETPFNKFSTRKSENIEVENVNALPNEYKTVKVVESADKAAIKAAIKAGKKIEGATLNQNINLKIN